MEGPLYIEISVVEWREVYCIIKEKQFQVYNKLRASVPASISNCGDVILEFGLLPEECDCKSISMSLSALSRLMKSSALPQTPFFFNIYITTEDLTYHFASSSDSDRLKWIEAVRLLRRPQARNANSWVRANGFLSQGNLRQNENIFSGGDQPNARTPSPQRSRRQGDTRASKPASPRLADDIQNRVDQENSETKAAYDAEVDPDSRPVMKKPSRSGPASSQSRRADKELSNTPYVDIKDDDLGDQDLEDREKEAAYCLCFAADSRICGIKLETLSKLIRIILAFPFIIVSSSLNFQSSAAVITSMGIIRFMNILVYALPVILVRFVLSEFLSVTVERFCVGLYMLVLISPVGYIAFNKVRMASSTHKVEDGTFCFRPAMTVRLSQANAYAILGFLFEWFQHVLYVIPTGILTSSTVSQLSDYPPYLKFEVYFWGSVACSFACGLILVVNSVLRGKAHYRFQRSEIVWFFLYNVSSPMYVTIVTILFMGLSCNYDTNPPTLYQDESIVCYRGQHILIARAALMALSIYLIQNTLLPSGTFKETMRDPYLDIVFVPVYLQAHFLFKAIFSGVYVFFYTDNLTRVIVLTIINLILLYLNNSMKPCSVEWINLLRDLFFIHASISGLQGLNYLGWPANYSTKGMLISTLASNIIFTTVAMLIYLQYTSRSVEYMIAKAFLDLEWQVSRRSAVHPRVLEPLISLTLSPNQVDKDIVKKYIGQLVFLISYPNMRVQFQSAWGLANIALIDEDCRLKIHEAGGTKTLFEWYDEMESIAQLESLAAMTNLSLSQSVVTEDMVNRYKCIPFFINIITSNKIRYAPQFAAIALANLARKESFRELIRESNGIAALVSNIMSQDYQKRRTGCLALANMALSPSPEIEQAFTSTILIDRVLKMAKRKEIETQKEVIALIRNLSCHSRIRPLLLDREIMTIVRISKDSIYSDVVGWCEEIRVLMEREIALTKTDVKILLRRDESRNKIRGDVDMQMLDRMLPLSGQVDWSTWGSKLENIFSPIFVTIPTVRGGNVTMKSNTDMKINLAEGIPKSILLSWRDNMKFIIVEVPSRGKLNEYKTDKDHVIYSPHTNYSGQDRFTYILQLGNLKSWAATVHITIEADPDSKIKRPSLRATVKSDDEDIEKGESFGSKRYTRQASNAQGMKSSTTLQSSMKSPAKQPEEVEFNNIYSPEPAGVKEDMDMTDSPMKQDRASGQATGVDEVGVKSPSLQRGTSRNMSMSKNSKEAFMKALQNSKSNPKLGSTASAKNSI